MVTIKEAAALAGLTVKAIRHYERIGLAEPSARTEAGYRLYSSEAIFRLRQIQYYRELKFPLQDIAALLDAPRENVRAAMERQSLVVARQLEEYRRAHAVLNAALSGGGERGPVPGGPGLAVIALDLQNDILEGGALPCKRILSLLPNLSDLFKRARSLGVPIIYVCDQHRKGDQELLLWNDHMMEGTWGARVIDRVAPQEGDLIVYKNLFNGFVNTNLQTVLESICAKTLLFTGWRTHVCVAQTAIEAFYRGYRVVIASDGVGSTTRSEHEYGMALMEINYGFEFYPCAEALETLLGVGG